MAISGYFHIKITQSNHRFSTARFLDSLPRDFTKIECAQGPVLW